MESAANPLLSVANRFPTQALRAASIAGRLFGALLLVAVAFDQSYDPTQVFTAVAAGVVALTLVSLPGAPGDWMSALGAGVVFFAGAVLTHLEPGLTMLAMGLLSGLATFALAARANRNALPAAAVFVCAVFVTAALQVAIVFGFE